LTCEEKIQALLIASDALIALVAMDHISVPGDWQGRGVPYILHQPIVGRTIHTHVEGLAGLRQWDFYEVSIYATSYSEARTLGDLVVTALDGYRDDDVDRIALAHTPTTVPYDTDRKIARVTLDFEVAGGLT
jgi:hypothetical protein